MTPPVPQRTHRDNLLAANRAVIRRIREAVSDVPTDSIARRPPDGGWSIGEVLEHLIVSADSYLASIRALIAQHRHERAAANATWKPTLGGGLLTWSLRSPRKIPAPGVYKPGPSARPRVLEEFLVRQEEVGRLIAEAGDIDWRRLRMRSPVTPLLRMNLGDALTVLVVHAQRHAAQIERVKAGQSALEPLTTV